MSDLVEMILDAAVEFFMKLAEDKQGRALWVRITALVLGVCAMLAYFGFLAYTSWQNGNDGKMLFSLCMLAIVLTLILTLAVRRIVRHCREKEK